MLGSAPGPHWRLAGPRKAPHLVVKLKPLHVHTQELGVYFELSCLVSRGDVKDHVSEAVRDRI